MKPPPPPKPRPRGKTPTVSEVDKQKDEDPSEKKTDRLAISLLIGSAIAVLLLLLICAGGIGGAIAYRSFGGGGGDGDDVSVGDFGSTGISNFDEEDSQSGQAGNEQSETDDDDSSGQANPEKSDPAGENTAESTDSQPVDSEDSTSDGQSSSGGTGGVNIPGATFFGISSSGERVVYVVDCSGSMKGRPLEKAKAEILRSVRSLLVSQKYLVIFFDEDEYPMYWPTVSNSLVDGSDENLAKTEKWVRNFQVGGGTDPTRAMQRAISLQPDSIFLLTDGEFDASVPVMVRSKNSGRSKINTISFMTRDGESLLKQIAEENDGVYRHVP